MSCVSDYSTVFCNANGKKNHILCRKAKVGIMYLLDGYKVNHHTVIVHVAWLSTETDEVC